jgi:hypothetical protein
MASPMIRLLKLLMLTVALSACIIVDARADSTPADPFSRIGTAARRLLARSTEPFKFNRSAAIGPSEASRSSSPFSWLHRRQANPPRTAYQFWSEERINDTARK